MPEPVELTTKLLMDTGGWREMKEARAIHAAGSVEEASYAKGKLEGLVFTKGRSRKVRVDIRTRTWWDNHCTCPLAKRDGAVCAHALAVALQIIDPVEKAEPVSSSEGASSSPSAPVAPPKPKLSPDWPKVTERPDDEAAIPGQLFVVLAPNVASAWEKGRLTAGIEIELEGRGRTLLGAAKIPGDRKLFLGPRDALVWRALQAISPEQVPGMMQIGRADFLTLIESLAGHPRATFGKKQAARIAYSPLRPALTFANTSTLRASWPDEVIPLVDEETSWALDTNRQTFHPVASGLPTGLRPVLTSTGLKLDPVTAPAVLGVLGDVFELPEETEARLPTTIAPAIELDLEGSLNHLEATLYFRYADRPRTPAGAATKDFFSDPEQPDRLLAPDLMAERAAIDSLTRWEFAGPNSKGTFVLKDKEAILRFFAHGFPKLDTNWKITTGPRFEHASDQVEPVGANFEFTSSGENWFAMELEFDTPSGGRFSREEIQRLLQKGQGSQQIKGGKIAVLDPELVDELSEAITDLNASQDRPGVFKVSSQHAGYLQQTAEDRGIGVRGKAPWKTGPEKEVEFASLPEELDSLLRPYQREGIAWMQSLVRRGMSGGILADDMGLGKTLQALSLIRSLSEGDSGPALVVCPSSLVFNWMAEAEKFVPELKAVALQGSDRHEVFAANPDADLYVTSHTLLRIDAEDYRDRDFGVAILDEAQHIKNHDAQVSKAAHALKARYRFALTGTPIENSVRDLWSVSQFALPGYLGPRKDFTERFEKPIAGGNAQSTQQRLARRLKPIVLRRLKTEVARDLPDKIEQVVYCELRDEQRAVYEQLVRESRSAVLDAEGGRKRMIALTALLRLRQACCDLRLLGLPDVKPDDGSVKLEAVEELVADAVEGGHRVLVFSQFVEMLQVLVPMLAERGWKHAYLDGSTRNRGDVVKRFQESADIPVFLISLKAGGVGLNLTAADTVIHVDPWWNPAVEAQATDRAHRIGQERVVTSYKLIARGTVEEKILALQERKKETIRAMLDQGEDGGDAGLTEDEILELLE